MSQPELDRVGACCNRELIHEGLDRKDVVIGAETTKRRNAQRHVGHELVHDARVRQRVKRNTVAIAGAVRLLSGPWRAGLEGLLEVTGGDELPRARRARRMRV